MRAKDIYCVSSSAGQTLKVAEACNFEVIAYEGSDLIFPKTAENLDHFNHGKLFKILPKKSEVSCDEFIRIVVND